MLPGAGGAPETEPPSSKQTLAAGYENALLHLSPRKSSTPLQKGPQTPPGSWAQIPLTHNCLLRILISPKSEFLSNSVSALNREDKVRIVAFLQDNGVFRFKGAINIVAKRLNFSRYTVYNYLEEVRSNIKKG